MHKRDIDPTRENRYRFRAAQTELKETYRTEQETYIKSKIEMIKSSAINKQAALAWKTVNEVLGRKSSNKAKLKASDQKERIDKWKTHFQNLLDKTPRISIKETTRVVEGELNIMKGSFSMEELKAAMKQIKSGKACGLDNIPAEVWLTGNFDNKLFTLINWWTNRAAHRGHSRKDVRSFGMEGTYQADPRSLDMMMMMISKKMSTLLQNGIQMEIKEAKVLFYRFLQPSFSVSLHCG